MTQLGLPYELHLTLLILSIAVVWVVCGVFTYGWIKAFSVSCGQYHRVDEVACWFFAFAMWPITLPISLCMGDFRHGLMFRNPHRNKQEI